MIAYHGSAYGKIRIVIHPREVIPDLIKNRNSERNGEKKAVLAAPVQQPGLDLLPLVVEFVEEELRRINAVHDDL